MTCQKNDSVLSEITEMEIGLIQTVIDPLKGLIALLNKEIPPPVIIVVTGQTEVMVLLIEAAVAQIGAAAAVIHADKGRI